MCVCIMRKNTLCVTKTLLVHAKKVTRVNKNAWHVNYPKAKIMSGVIVWLEKKYVEAINWKAWLHILQRQDWEFNTRAQCEAKK